MLRNELEFCSIFHEPVSKIFTTEELGLLVYKNLMVPNTPGSRDFPVANSLEGHDPWGYIWYYCIKAFWKLHNSDAGAK
jgi:hypothetical protein